MVCKDFKIYFQGIDTDSGKLGLELSNGEAVTATYTMYFSDYWDFFAFTFDGTEAKAYRLIYEEESESCDSLASGGPVNFTIGAAGFEFKIDNLRIYNKALSPEEVENLCYEEIPE